MYEIALKIIDSDLSRELSMIMIKRLKIINPSKTKKKITIDKIKSDIRREKIFLIASSSYYYDDFNDFEGDLLYFIETINKYVDKYQSYYDLNGEWKEIYNIHDYFCLQRKIIDEINKYHYCIYDKEYRLHGEVKEMKLFNNVKLQDDEKYNMNSILLLFPDISEVDSTEEIIWKLSATYPNKNTSLYANLASDIKYFFEKLSN